MNSHTSKFNGSRVCEAREARALTRTALAELVGVSAGSISKYEKGTQTPRPDLIQRMVDVLRLPTHYFIATGAKPEPLLSWRSTSRAKITHKHRAAARFAWLCRSFAVLTQRLQFPEVNVPNLNLPEDPHDLTPAAVEAAATTLRRHWGLGDGPISDLVRLAENKGVVVVRNEMADHLDAFFDRDCITGERPYVLLKREESSACRSRLSLAHELGHMVLHTRVTRDPARRSELHATLEDQANHFAGAFLLPEATFPSEVYSASLRGLLPLKRRWKVSVAAMIRRLHTLNEISDRRYQSLNIEISRAKWRTIEPLDEDIEVEQPQLIRRAVDLLFDNGRITRSQFEMEAGLYADDIASVLGVPEHSLDDSYDEPYKLTFT